METRLGMKKLIMDYIQLHILSALVLNNIARCGTNVFLIIYFNINIMEALNSSKMFWFRTDSL